MKEDQIKVILVLPCLNEEKNLKETCASLGFGIGTAFCPLNSILIIVNNNSTDSTDIVANQVKANSIEDSVIVEFEAIRGYVPARHKGNLIAKQIAEQRHWPISEVLILQVDADSIYTPTYVDIMRAETSTAGPNILIQACVDYVDSFKEQFQSYIETFSKIDNNFEKLFGLFDDFIVDDKAAGYRLSDYFIWGEHRREYFTASEEIYAETTRLYISAKAHGAQRRLVADAKVLHSDRKIIKYPFLHLATAGFPRNLHWHPEWQKIMNIAQANQQTFYSQFDSPEILEVIEIRKQHLITLFFILPLHIQEVIGTRPTTEIARLADIVLSICPKRAFDDLMYRPGIFLADAFDIINYVGAELVVEAQKFCKEET